MRKPLTGRLNLRIQGIKDVDHAATSRFARGPETFVVVKVEDAVKARTKSTRNDRFTEENFDIDIDKANEIEITVYDRSGDRPVPIGMLWIRISDIQEEMRRKKIETEFNNSGWVSADRMADDRGSGNTAFNPNAPPSQAMTAPNAARANTFAVNAGGPGGNQVWIDAWFALEPVGQIQLNMSFGEYRQHLNLYWH